MAIVYRHRRLDTNEIFYIGIGKEEKRAYSKHGRNNWWKKIVNKANYQVEIIAKDLNYEDAKELEVLLIQEYGRKDLNNGSLINLTQGGDGVLQWSKESRERQSKKYKDTNISEEIKNKIANTMKEKFKNNPDLAKKVGDFHRGNKYCVGKIQPKEVIEKRINKMKKWLLDLETGIFYFGLEEAANAHCITKKKLSNWMCYPTRNKTNLIYV